jgi:glutaredoxin
MPSAMGALLVLAFLLAFKTGSGKIRMTTEMAFECLLVSDDSTVLNTMDPILRDFSIRLEICPQSQRTGDWLEKNGSDLIVVDMEAENSSEVLQKLQELRVRQKPTIVAVSKANCELAGVHITLRKPVTRESGIRSLKVAYSKMLQDFRKHTRFALIQTVLATDEKNRTFSVTITNIGAGGVGLKTNETIEVGSVLSCGVRLPDLEAVISFRVRVLWARPSGVAGGEFVYMPALDAELLQAWLENRCRIKKPLADVE